MFNLLAVSISLDRVDLTRQLTDLKKATIKENPRFDPDRVPLAESTAVENQLHGLLNAFISEQAKQSIKVQQAAKAENTALTPPDDDYYAVLTTPYKAPRDIPFETTDLMIKSAKHIGHAYVEMRGLPERMSKETFSSMLYDLRREAIRENPHLDPDRVPRARSAVVEAELRSALNDFITNEAKRHDPVQLAARSYHTATVPPDGDYFSVAVSNAKTR